MVYFFFRGLSFTNTPSPSENSLRVADAVLSHCIFHRCFRAAWIYLIRDDSTQAYDPETLPKTDSFISLDQGSKHSAKRAYASLIFFTHTPISNARVEDVRE